MNYFELFLIYQRRSSAVGLVMLRYNTEKGSPSSARLGCRRTNYTSYIQTF